MGETESCRAVSFCGHAILYDDIMVVPDATRDHRFWDNPMVCGEPFIRFYAGFPLKGPDGHRIGTLCIADRNPRILQDGERQVLTELGRIVEREFTLVETVPLQSQLIAVKEQVGEAHQMRLESLGQVVES